MNLNKYSALVMRLGLAFVFGLFGVDKIIHHPLGVDWTGWVPAWMPLPQALFLYVLGALEVIAAIMLLIGKYVRLAALACAALLIGVLVNFGVNEITARDLGLTAMALALAMLPEHRKYHELHELAKKIHKK